MYPLLETDVYKTVHHEQYPKDMSYLTSYFIPRKSRTDEDFLIMFGLQYYIKNYLIDDWNKNFFELPFEEAIQSYKFSMNYLLGTRFADTRHSMNLDICHYELELFQREQWFQFVFQ